MKLPLTIHLIIHFLTGILSGLIVYLLWHQALISFAGGIIGAFFIDLDHFIDYLLVFKLKFRLNYFFGGYAFIKSSKLYIFFHGFEISMIEILISLTISNFILKSFLLSIGLGSLFHLVSDVWMNHIPFKTYWLTFRLLNNFNVKKLITDKEYQKHIEDKRRLGY